ncbi:MULTISPECIES: MurR/RpiR family transcriptional regulator [unclassified Rhizobium]|uniref:MurR/RpiR family transcriptional regulator n=1 Tax=unclassified Rhizobium TaxID=2613769 RepID=UPI000A208388|nr:MULTISPECIES: MurR/RpiR family transcriptional regulator [unclassified Rhizobium]ARO33089.1 RpiR family transcriptional regulator protein [Rhizobium sp. NXC14]MDK4734280.1 MurR/RpiR family transcriptional regulator [Rhizobium sp. CNPSo 3490]
MTVTDEAAGFAKPATIEELRNLTVRINRENANISLGNKALDVLAKLVDTPEQTAVRTISELADALGVNASTLTRLSQKLGFAGFSDFQSVFRQAFSSDDRYFYSRQAGRLLSTKEDSEEELHIFDRLGLETKNNIDGFLAQIEPNSLLEAAGLLANARRVRIHGVRQFHAFASFLTYGLGMLRSDVSLLDAPRLGVAEALAQLEKGDVVVVASCAPYTRSVANVAEIAAKLGLIVIAVTDTRASPLVGPSRHAFFVPHASSFFSNSMGAYIVFCEGLLNLVARELGERAIQALAKREELISTMRIET